jgi:hypothetical protein
MRMYADRLLGTASETFVLSLDDDALIHWRLGAPEKSCSDCPRLARNGPYTKASLPTTPSAGATQCLTNCNCRLASGGVDCFRRVA